MCAVTATIPGLSQHTELYRAKTICQFSEVPIQSLWPQFQGSQALWDSCRATSTLRVDILLWTSYSLDIVCKYSISLKSLVALRQNGPSKFMKIIAVIYTPNFRLKELLRNRLKECGWREQIKSQCGGMPTCTCTLMSVYHYCLCICIYLYHAEIIARKGLSNVTVDSLVQDVTPKARGLYCYDYIICHALKVQVCCYVYTCIPVFKF